MKSLSIKVVGLTLALFLSIIYTICIVFCLIWPEFAMYKMWAPLLPGFFWINWQTFFLGLVESFIWGYFLTIIFVPIYNMLNRKMCKES